MRLGELIIQSERLGASIQNALNLNIFLIVEYEERIAVGNTGVSAGVERV